MSSIRWRKTYNVKTKEGVFKLFVSRQWQGGYYASLFYCVLVGERLLHAPGEENPGYLEFRLEKRFAATEQRAFEEIMTWASQKFQLIGEPILISEESEE